MGSPAVLWRLSANALANSAALPKAIVAANGNGPALAMALVAFSLRERFRGDAVCPHHPEAAAAALPIVGQTQARAHRHKIGRGRRREAHSVVLCFVKLESKT